MRLYYRLSLMKIFVESRMTLTKAKGARLYDMMGVYEANYRRLMGIVPDLRRIRGTVFSELHGRPVLFLDMVEQCKYTSLLAITHYLSVDNRLVADLSMKVRAYHDARLAEVISYQRQSRFLPINAYPNPRMHQPFEKRQVNLFLREWLDFCLQHGCRFQALDDATP